MPEISAQLSEEDVKNLARLVERGEIIVDNFLLDSIGDMTYADTPSIDVWGNKKIFKYPIKTENKKFVIGNIYIDPSNMSIIEELSSSIEDIKRNCETISIDSND